MKKLLLIILTGIGGISLSAQQTVSTAGGNATGTGGSVSYSAGQAGYSYLTGSNGSVAEGVQQPFEISVITSLEEAKNISLEFSVYPNPVTANLILKINGDAETQCIASLLNINGIILQTIKVETNETTISMQGYSSGTYILKIMAETPGMASLRIIKTFKIIKH